MATKKTTGSKGKGGSVSLADEDRRYLNESLGKSGAGMDEGSVFEALERFGLSSDRVQRLKGAIADMEVRESIDKASEYLAEQIENAKGYTRDNPKKVIGGAAGVLVGASLLALAIRRAAGEEKRSSTSKKKAAAGRKGGKATAASTSSSSASSSKKGGSSSSSRKSSSSKKSKKR